MFKLKLIRGVHYSYKNVEATKENPIIEIESKMDADYLVSTGCFELLEAPKNENESKAEAKPKRSRSSKNKG